jgi:hypothetical protein
MLVGRVKGSEAGRLPLVVMPVGMVSSRDIPVDIGIFVADETTRSLLVGLSIEPLSDVGMSDADIEAVELPDITGSNSLLLVDGGGCAPEIEEVSWTLLLEANTVVGTVVSGTSIPVCDAKGTGPVVGPKMLDESSTLLRREPMPDRMLLGTARMSDGNGGNSAPDVVVINGLSEVRLELGTAREEADVVPITGAWFSPSSVAMTSDGCGSAVDNSTCVMLGPGTGTESTGRDAAVEGSSTGSMSVEVEMITGVKVAGIALDRGSGSCAGGACCADVALGCCSAVELACCCDDGSGCAGSGTTLGIVVGSGALIAIVDEGRTAEELGLRVEDGSSTGAAMDGDGRGALVGFGTSREDSLIEAGIEDGSSTGAAMDGDGRGALVGLGTSREDSLIEAGIEDGSSIGTTMDGDGRGALVGLGTGRDDSLIGDGMEDEIGTLKESGISADDNIGNGAVVEGCGSAPGTTIGSDVGNGALDIGTGSVVVIAVVNGAGWNDEESMTEVTGAGSWTRSDTTGSSAAELDGFGGVTSLLGADSSALGTLDVDNGASETGTVVENVSLVMTADDDSTTGTSVEVTWGSDVIITTGSDTVDSGSWDVTDGLVSFFQGCCRPCR